MIHYNVAPRYTPGSPALVSERIAREVAQQERAAWSHAAEGVYGPRIRERAQADTLRGIVERREERAQCWLVTDLITNERFIRPFDVLNETPLRFARRMLRLRERYGLPLERDLSSEPYGTPTT